MEIDLNDFKEIINELPYLSLIEEKGKFILDSKFNRTLELEVDFVENIIDNLKEKRIEGESILYDEYTYEVLIKFESSRPLLRIRMFRDEESIIKKDTANGLVYELSYASDEYLIFILKMFKDLGIFRDIIRPTPFVREKMRDKVEKTNFFEFFRRMLPQLYTLKIKSKEPMSVSKFSNLANAFLFNLSYNLDIAVIEVKSLYGLIRYRFGRIRRAKLDEIEPPRRVYIPDLVYHYQMAISTDSPPFQFLSFYHIIEHFFYDIYHEDLLNTIKTKITSPDFSYKRKRDIESLIKLISQKLKYRDENLTYNEQEALYLTLNKYVNLNNIVDRLREYDESLIDYYKNEVPFSQGSTIDFGSCNTEKTEKVFKKIADRIYKTRNSIVHSKEAGRPKYVPFRDDRELLKEIPLIRFIAEEIIINNSKIL